MKFLKRTACVLFSLIFGTSVSLADEQKQTLSSIEQKILESVVENFDASLRFLEKTVNINSGTMNHDGVRAVGEVYATAFSELDFDIEWIDQTEVNRAGHLVAKRKGKGKNLLLIGHLDTVFPKDSPVQNFEREGETIAGPGVNDMKGGNAVVLYALKALHELGSLEGKSITVFFTGDEEKAGKPINVSRHELIAEAKKSHIALNFEGGQKGLAVISRRGASSWQLTVTGRRRHSSGIFRDDVGAGAVFEASRILNAFYDELSTEEYLTFNPGIIVGGTEVAYDPEANTGDAFGKTNVVAQSVVVHGGLRFISEEQKQSTRDRMREITAQNLPHTGAEITFTDAYPAMSPTEGNAQLLDIYSTVSEDLGFGSVEANDPANRGAADISFVAPYVSQSMDGLGVTGSGAHTPEESMQVSSLKEATMRTAILIHRLLEDPNK